MSNRYLVEAAKRRNVYFVLISALIFLFLVAYFSVSIEQDQFNRMSQTSVERRRLLIKYFNVSDEDASRITWAHAVNSKHLLAETLKSKKKWFILQKQSTFLNI
jgi:hypothetical protein